MQVSAVIRNGVAALCAGFVACSAGGACAQELRLAQGFEYTRGLYGGRLATETFIGSTSLRYTDGAWTFSIVVPYVRVAGPGAPFAPFAVSAFALRPPPDLEGDVLPLLSLPDDTSFTYDQFSVTSEGIGDVVLGGGRSFELSRERLFLDVSLLAKLPTGDADELIGTGETDLTARGDLVFETGRFGLIAGGGHVFTGRSDRFDLDNRWQASAGAYVPVGRRITLGALYDWRQSILEGSRDLSEATVYASARIGARWSLLGYVVAGLSEASPDFGAGLRLAVDFDIRDVNRAD